MAKQKSSIFFKILAVCGVLLFAVIAYVVLTSTSTVRAIVPAQSIVAGTQLEDNMLKIIQIPSNTPKGYITDKSSLVGQKLKVNVDEDQLLYINDTMSSWSDFDEGRSVPDDYVVTAIQIPSNKAVGGLITPGDVVDILGIPNSQNKTLTPESLRDQLGEVAKTAYGAKNGLNTFWVLSNVKILETDSTLSQSNKSSMSTITEEENSNSDGAFYIVALSYDDYKKLRLCEQYLDLWMNIAPVSSRENGPALDDMTNPLIQGLKDSQNQSKIDVEDKKKNP